MSTANPPPPRPPPRLQRLRARHARWREARAARRALFTRPTPISAQLKLVARMHRLVDLAYALLSMLIGLKFLWRLAGWEGEGLFYTVLEFITWPFLQAFEALLPALDLGPNHRIEPGDLAALVVYGVLSRLLHWLIHRLGYAGRQLGRFVRREQGG